MIPWKLWEELIVQALYPEVWFTGWQIRWHINPGPAELNPDMLCLCKQCQRIWICTVIKYLNLYQPGSSNLSLRKNCGTVWQNREIFVLSCKNCRPSDDCPATLFNRKFLIIDIFFHFLKISFAFAFTFLGKKALKQYHLNTKIVILNYQLKPKFVCPVDFPVLEKISVWLTAIL